MKIIILSFFAFILSGCEPAQPSIEELTPKSPFHGIHGLGFDNQGHLLAGSVVGGTIYQVDITNGQSRIFMPPPQGQADDIAFAENGDIAWTAFLEGKIYLLTRKGQIKILAENLPGINSIDFAPNGKLYATQVFLGDALYEIDVQGKKPPRKIMEKMGGLNGFEIGRDGKLYGPLWFKGEVVSVDLDKAKIKSLAKGFQIPAAVNFDPRGSQNMLYVVDTKTGAITKLNIRNGKKTKIAQVKPAIDNLAFNHLGELYISNMADNAIIHIDKKTGASKTITSGVLAAAADLALWKDELYIADVFALRKLNIKNGQITEIARMFGDELDYPMHVAVNDRYIATTGWSAGSVQIFDRKSEKSLSLLHGFTTPHDLVIMPNGELIIAEFATGSLLRLSGKKWASKKTIATGFAGPSNLLLSEDSKYLYLIEYIAGRLIRLDLANNQIKIIAQGLHGAEGLCFLPDGRFLLSEGKYKHIIAINDLGEREILAENLPIHALTLGPIPPVIPTGLAVDEKGDIYFSSDQFANIWKIISPH